MRNAAGCRAGRNATGVPSYLTVNHCSTTEVTACDSYVWQGTVYTVSGVYLHGSDTLVLTVNYSNAAVETVTACNSYLWHGTVYTVSTNMPTYTTTNAAGCDSVTTLHLTVNHCSTTEVTACDSYTWHGTVYNVSGTFVDGRDTLVLTVNYSNAVTEMVTACDGYEWHGTTYVVSTNNPTFVATNAAGCDSVVTLHLTVGDTAAGISGARLPVFDMELYPNPTTALVTVEAEGVRCVTVYNVNGQRVGCKMDDVRCKMDETSNIRVDLTGLPAGVYMLKVETDRGSGLAKVIKK